MKYYKKGLYLLSHEELLVEAFKVLSNRLTEIKFLKNEIEKTTKYKKTQLSKRLELNINDSFLSATNFSCYNPYTNSLIRLGYKEDTTETRINTILDYYNRQCLWLLVEAYEEFEIYLNTIYKKIILIDNSFEIKKVNRVNILKKFRTKIKNFKEIEIDNTLNVNFKVMIILLSKIRHLSVHSNATSPDKNLFINKILQESDISTKKELGKYLFKQIDNLFEKDKIILKTIHFSEKSSSGIYSEINTDRFNMLLGRLGSYSLLIHIEISKHLNGINTI